MRKNTEQNILHGVSKFGWENLRPRLLEVSSYKAETRPPREREPGSGLELTPIFSCVGHLEKCIELIDSLSVVQDVRECA